MTVESPTYPQTEEESYHDKKDYAIDGDVFFGEEDEILEEEDELGEEEDDEELGEEEEEEEEGEEDDGTRWTDWETDASDRWVLQDQANAEVDAYRLDDIDARVYVRSVPNKGRCLFTRYALKPGDVIFVESPVLSCTRKLHPKLWKAVSEDCKAHNTDQDMPASWHYAALYSLLHLPTEAKKAILDKWHPRVDRSALSPDVTRIVENVKYARHVDPYEYENMLMAWRYNCFGHHTDNHGLVCYNRISMMAHCCESSATWHYGTSNDQFVLRARHHMKKGDEITITYVGDDDLMKSKDNRRDRLSSWLFICRCVKCAEEHDKARGIRCPSCGAGVVYFTTNDGMSKLDGDDPTKVTDTTVCPSCRYTMTDDERHAYLEFEAAYIKRLNDCSSEDLVDCESVMVEAGRVMINHWVLYELHMKLHEGYKALGEWDTVIFHLQYKIDFITHVLPSPSYQLAWLHEEMGDDLIMKHLAENGNASSGSYWDQGDDAPALNLTLSLKNRIVRSYESAMNLFLASCGDTHTYTLTCHWKMEFITSLEPENPSAPTATANMRNPTEEGEG